MSKTNKESEEQAIERFGMIIHSDGGARPTNPGPSGWGMHGYMFNAVKPKKGSGNSDHVLTTQGYVLKADFQKLNAPEITEKHWEDTLERRTTKPFEVTPVHYVDGRGVFSLPQSNNYAELAASTAALEYAKDYAIQYIHVITDSKYVQENVDRVSSWERNDWLTSNGTPVANAEAWKRLRAAKAALEMRGIKVYFSWIKGHNDHLGNDTADHAATAAALEAGKSQRLLLPAQDKVEITSTPADGYWKYDPQKHPFIANRWMYFNGSPEFVNPGEYFIGDHGKDAELLGKRMSNGAFSVVYLDQPDPILELVRRRQFEICSGNMVCLARLDEVFRPETHRELVEYGEFAIDRRKRHLFNTFTLGGRPLVDVADPPRLAHRVADAVEVLKNKLALFLSNDPSITVTDLSPILYESTLKSVKKTKGEKEASEVTVYTLKPEYNTGFASLQVDANYKDDEGTKSAPLILVLGIDLLERNALKRLESLNPRVSLITWMEAEKVFRYATVIQAGEDVGIWAGVYSNTRVLA